MRSKEEAHDYRYFPDPDLLPLELTQAYVDELAPSASRAAGREEGAVRVGLWACGLRCRRACRRARERRLLRGGGQGGDSGARCQARCQLGHQRAVRPLNKEGKGIADRRSRRRSSATILDLIGEGTISGKIAKDLFEIVWAEGGDPRAIVAARGMKQVTDTAAIAAVVDEIVAANPDKVAQVKAKPTMLGWFVGQVMKASGGKANPQAVNELLKEKLGI